MKKRLKTIDSFKARVAELADGLKVKPTQIRMQRMTRKWASCSSCGWVSFSLDLLKQPRSFQEYVIIHELVHFKVPNHGKLFQRLMDAFSPGWKGKSPK